MSVAFAAVVAHAESRFVIEVRGTRAVVKSRGEVVTEGRWTGAGLEGVALAPELVAALERGAKESLCEYGPALYEESGAFSCFA